MMMMILSLLALKYHVDAGRKYIKYIYIYIYIYILYIHCVT